MGCTYLLEIRREGPSDGSVSWMLLFAFARTVRNHSLVSPIGPLWLQMEPPSPTLEQLWEGQVDLSLQGPADRSVEIGVSLSEIQMANPRLSHGVSLPFLCLSKFDDWRCHFAGHYLQNETVMRKTPMT